MLARWIEQDGDKGAQAAGEFAMAAKIVGGDDDPLRDFATAMVEGPVSPQRLGCLFAASAAWRHNAGDLRDQARMIDSDFVSIAIALQRAHGSQRARAMDLYERLLDAEAYGASEAATAALRH